MHVVSHFHPPSASSASAVLTNFIPSHPRVLAVVKHTSIVFLALPSDAGSDAGEFSPNSLFKEIASLDIHARIVCLRFLPGTTGSGEQDAPAKLLLLTDHQQPRLISIQYDPKSKPDQHAFLTDAVVHLEEVARPPAELGLGVLLEQDETVASGTLSKSDYVVSHTHSGLLKVTPVGPGQTGDKKGKGKASGRRASGKGRLSTDGSGSNDSVAATTLQARSAFGARLPHPTLIEGTFLNRADPATEESVLCLLSLSSTPSRIAGLGPQCMPVLSFHHIDSEEQSLKPVPWGPERKPPPEQKDKSSTPSKRKASGSTSQDGSAGASTQPKKGKYGPSATGRTRDAATIAKEEAKLAQSLFARAHVPLPVKDALGAHHIHAVPAAWGGGVLVFSETSIVYVPPPSAVSQQRSGSDAQGAGLSIPQDSEASKRRKGSSSGGKGKGEDEEDVAFSPESVENENGKRARKNTEDTSALSTSPETLRSPTSSGRRGSSSALSAGRASLLKMNLKLPVKVIASTSLPEIGKVGDVSVGRVLYCTHAGHLECLNIHLASDTPDGRQPVRLSIQQLGQTSRPGGPDGLTYLGEGHVHIASVNGDSTVVSLRERFAENIDAEIKSPMDTDPKQREALPVAHRWPNIAPILDYVVDDGNGGNVKNGNAVQARVITASGAESSGSLRVIRSGVSIDSIAQLTLEEDATAMWAVPAAADGSKLFILECTSGRKFWRLTAEAGIEDVSQLFQAAGLKADDPALDVAALQGAAPGEFLIATKSGIHHIAFGSAVQIKSHTLSGKITAASISSAGTAVLATDASSLQVVRSGKGGKLSETGSLALDDAVACLHVHEEAGLVAVGLWETKRIRLLSLSTLQDVTPRSMNDQPQSVLPTSIILQKFDHAKSDDIHMIAGFGDGSIAVYLLALPQASSASKSILVLERKEASIGSQPIQLSSVQLSTEQKAVFASCDRPTVIALDQERQSTLNYSAVQSKNVKAFAQLSVGAAEDPSSCIALLLPDRLEIASMGDIQKLDVQTVDLGADNPVALAQDPVHGLLGVCTFKFLPYGTSTPIDFFPDDGVSKRSGLKLFDQETLELVDSITVGSAMDRISCIEVMELNDERYFVVGVGRSVTEKSETEAGFVIGYTVVTQGKQSNGTRPTRMLKEAFTHDVQGHVYALAQVGNRLVAAVNSDVFVYDLDPDLGELRACSRWGCAFIACTLSRPDPGSNRLVVGDAMRSLAVLRVEAANGHITELARDADPYWSTAVELLDEERQQYIGADISFNLFVSERTHMSAKHRRRLRELRDATYARGEQRSSEQAWALTAEEQKEDETWTHMMKHSGVWHYGDFINKFGRETFIPSSTFPSEATPQVSFVTTGGAIGVISRVNKDKDSALLSQVERNLVAYLPAVGKISQEEWRTMRTEHLQTPPSGFLDGDLLQTFLTKLTPAEREMVLRGQKRGSSGRDASAAATEEDDEDDEDVMAIPDASVAQVTRLIENLARVC